MMRLPIKLAAGIAFAVLATGKAYPQSNPTGDPIEEVLSTLPPVTQVTGRTYPTRSMAELMRDHQVPAVSIALIEDGRILWSRAYGVADAATLRPATTETLFQAASISKPVAATAALALVEQDMLALDGPVNDRLSSWQVPENGFTEGAPITLRHLLTHTGGLTVHGFPGYQPGSPVPSVIQILDGESPANTPAVRVDQRPGSGWRYSGGGYTVAQLLMADATREEFPDLVERLVLRPIGMTRSTYRPLSTEHLNEAALAYRGDGTPVAGGYHLYPEMAAAGLWTTPEDLARWALAISSAYRGADGLPIGPETARAMLVPGPGQWGLGMHVQGEGEWLQFAHGGANEGYRAQLLMFPHRGEGIVVMTNGDNGATVTTSVIQAIGRMRGWPNSSPRIVTPVAVPRRSLEEAAGRYANDRVSAEVEMADDRLMLSVSEGPRSELVPQGNDAYFALEIGVEVQFLRDPATGRIVSAAGPGITLPRIP